MCQEFKVIFDDSSTPVTRFVNFVDFVSTWRRFIDILFARGDLNQSFNYYATHTEGIRQYDSSDTGHSDNVNIAAEHQEPAEVLSQLDNTSNSPVYGEYKCC